MPEERTLPPLDDDTAALALELAVGVRNALEEFHVQHLSDEQMAELNPLIRNAIATGLHAHLHRAQHPASAAYSAHQRGLVPTYWEPPELLEDYTDGADTLTWTDVGDQLDLQWQRATTGHAALQPPADCTRCGRRIRHQLGRWVHDGADGTRSAVAARRATTVRPGRGPSFRGRGLPHRPATADGSLQLARRSVSQPRKVASAPQEAG